MKTTIYKILPDAVEPVRADKAALGLMPVRAYRFCEAMRQASALGWYVYTPKDFEVVWDGQDIQVAIDGNAYMSGGLDSLRLPGSVETFRKVVPESCADLTPPWITILPEPGTMQIWTGLFVETEPGWSTLVRAPSNLPKPGNYEHFEGLVDTDVWFGPLFINLRLIKTDTAIRFNRGWPIAMIVPVQRCTIGDALNNVEIAPIQGIRDDVWDQFQLRFDSRAKCPQRPGDYAVAARRRRKIMSGLPLTPRPTVNDPSAFGSDPRKLEPSGDATYSCAQRVELA